LSNAYEGGEGDIPLISGMKVYEIVQT